MRSIHCLQTGLSVALLGCMMSVASSGARAQILPNNPYYYSNQTYSYGLQLPQVPLPNGQDEIRAADGTSCRSSMASNSAYLDVGALGSQGLGGEVNGGTFYGRIIMPLGETPKRLDCSNLYNLEIQRLKHELELVRSGMSGNPLAIDPEVSAMKVGGPVAGKRASHGASPSQYITGPSANARAGSNALPKGKAWAEQGWSTSGWSEPQKVGASPSTGTMRQLGPAPQRVTLADLDSAQLGAEAAMPEVLPWSSQLAEGARVRVLMPRRSEALTRATVAPAKQSEDFTRHLGFGF